MPLLYDSTVSSRRGASASTILTLSASPHNGQTRGNGPTLAAQPPKEQRLSCLVRCARPYWRLEVAHGAFAPTSRLGLVPRTRPRRTHRSESPQHAQSEPGWNRWPFAASPTRSTGEWYRDLILQKRHPSLDGRGTQPDRYLGPQAGPTAAEPWAFFHHTHEDPRCAGLRAHSQASRPDGPAHYHSLHGSAWEQPPAQSGLADGTSGGRSSRQPARRQVPGDRCHCG